MTRDELKRMFPALSGLSHPCVLFSVERKESNTYRIQTKASWNSVDFTSVELVKLALEINRFVSTADIGDKT